VSEDQVTNKKNKPRVLQASWEQYLDDRQLKELRFARLYAAEFAHGTDGHNRLMLIDLLATLLDRADNAKNPPTDNG
jgi:hypothetical protein